MSKALLEFNLPEDQNDFDLAVNGSAFSCVLTDLDNELRNLSKHQNKPLITVDEVRKLIRELAEHYSILHLL
jgi:hypothetical protein